MSVRKLKIAHTESSCGWGGQELRAIGDVVYANKQGHDAILICDHRSLFHSRGCLCSDSLIRTSISSKNFLCLLAMRKTLILFRPDVVVCHSSTDSWLVAVVKLVTRLNYKILRVRHVRTDVKPGWTTRWLYRQALSIVTTSEDIRNHLIDRLNLLPNRVFSIPTGIDTSVDKLDLPISPTLTSLRPREGALVGMVSTLRSWKGHEVALNAIRELPNVSLVIVGDGPQYNEIKNLVQTLGLDAQVKVVGYQTNAATWINDFDILIQPSLHSEGVSQSVLQAMCLGVPVIASDIGGLNEVIIDNETGLLCERGNAKSLRDCIVRLMKSPDKRRSIIENAQHMVAQNYSYERLSREFLNVVEITCR